MEEFDTCSRYEIQKNDTFGRFAVASENFEPGDIIILESPYTFGPKSDSSPICLGCHREINCTTVCSTCGWPVCNQTCEKLPIHSENECQVFSSVKIRFTPVKNLSFNCPQYECITPLRVLLHKEKYPGKWESEIKLLESHELKRKHSEIWNVEEVNIVGFLHKVCKLEKRFSRELIHFVCGVLETNAFVTPVAFGFETRGLYPKASLLLHSCVPNVTHYIFQNYKMCVRAMIKIKKGQPLLLNYTQTLWPTLLRRAHLKEGKFFDCCCERCSDPTELGTNLSTLKCSCCENGWVLSNNPLDPNAQWNCRSCKFTISGNSVNNLFFNIQKKIIELEKLQCDPIASRENFIKTHNKILHSNNAFNVIVKQSLTELYGKLEGYLLDDLPELLLEKKIELCNLINGIFNIIRPGLSRQYAWNLYESHGPIVKLAENQFHRKEINKKQLKSRLQKAIKCLKEVVLIFSFDDPQSPEGITAKMASETLKNLECQHSKNLELNDFKEA